MSSMWLGGNNVALTTLALLRVSGTACHWRNGLGLSVMQGDQ
jgi:hypothetical protein